MPAASKVLQSLGSPHGGGLTAAGRVVAGTTAVVFLGTAAIQVRRPDERAATRATPACPDASRGVTRPGDLLARAFARMVVRSSDERLRWLSSGWRRRLVLAAILQQMPRRLDRGKARGVHAVVNWRLTGAPDGGIDHFQVRIDDGQCRVSLRPKESARATLELDGADFFRLAAGTAEGAELFMAGKLRIEGDLVFTAQLQSLFRIPARPRKR